MTMSPTGNLSRTNKYSSTRVSVGRQHIPLGNTRHPPTFFKISAPIFKVIFLIPSIKSILKTPPTPHSPRAVNTSGWFCFLVLVVSFPAAIYLFKVNNGLTRIMCNMCIYSKLPIKAPGTIQNKI